jgi:hypothetical protein
MAFAKVPNDGVTPPTSRHSHNSTHWAQPSIAFCNDLMPLAQISNLIIVLEFWGKDIEIVEVLSVELFNCWWNR